MSPVALECRSLGYPCEWALRGGSPQELVDRARDHFRCAHSMPDLSAEMLGRIDGAIHPV